MNAIALAPVEDFRRDSDLFGESAREPEVQSRFQAALQRGMQTRAAEMDFAREFPGVFLFLPAPNVDDVPWVTLCRM